MNNDLRSSTTVNCTLPSCGLEQETKNALQISNTKFRRSIINSLDEFCPNEIPVGDIKVTNMNLHPSEFVAYVVRAVAYVENNDNQDPNAVDERGELFLDGKHIKWNIQLNTQCGTLQSAAGANPSVIPRTMVINLPSA